jgi:hypothetical protein
VVVEAVGDVAARLARQRLAERRAGGQHESDGESAGSSHATPETMRA